MASTSCRTGTCVQVRHVSHGTCRARDVHIRAERQPLRKGWRGKLVSKEVDGGKWGPAQVGAGSPARGAAAFREMRRHTGAARAGGWKVSQGGCCVSGDASAHWGRTGGRLEGEPGGLLRQGEPSACRQSPFWYMDWRVYHGLATAPTVLTLWQVCTRDTRCCNARCLASWRVV